jgi:AhpD family alkylhydroperoxidase
MSVQPRMTHPAMKLPDAFAALQSFGTSIVATGVSPQLLELIHLRASQINGCSVCVDGHSRILKKAGESDERMFALAAWHDAPYFNDAERAALALTEAATRLADRHDPVPDEVWDQVASHFEDTELAALVLTIANINLWNRLNVTTRQPAGEWKP